MARPAPPRHLFVVGLVAAAACAPGPAAVAPAPSAARPSPASPADETWSSTSWEDRHDAMTWRVLPHMARAFQKFKKETSPTLTCRTCHGQDAEAVAYKMPNGLPALDRAHLPDPKSSEVARFMFDTVTPDMAEILGEPVFDPATKQGFSCFGCHPERR